MNFCKENGDFKKFVYSIGDVFFSLKFLNGSFLLENLFKLLYYLINVDIKVVRRCYLVFFKIGDSLVENFLINFLVALVLRFEMELRYMFLSSDFNFLN